MNWRSLLCSAVLTLAACAIPQPFSGFAFLFAAVFAVDAFCDLRTI